jgi:hypothetical protein
MIGFDGFEVKRSGWLMASVYDHTGTISRAGMDVDASSAVSCRRFFYFFYPSVPYKHSKRRDVSTAHLSEALVVWTIS